MKMNVNQTNTQGLNWIIIGTRNMTLQMWFRGVVTSNTQVVYMTFTKSGNLQILRPHLYQLHNMRDPYLPLAQPTGIFYQARFQLLLIERWRYHMHMPPKLGWIGMCYQEQGQRGAVIEFDDAVIFGTFPRDNLRYSVDVKGKWIAITLLHSSNWWSLLRNEAGSQSKYLVDCVDCVDIG